MIDDIISKIKEQIEPYIKSDSELGKTIAEIYLDGFVSGLYFDGLLLAQSSGLNKFWSEHLKLSKAVCRVKHSDLDCAAE